MSDPLLTFLTARLDETEATARGAARAASCRSEDGARWVVNHGTVDAPMGEITWGTGQRFDDPDMAGHVAAHDPAAVLADVEAKRALIDAIRSLQYDLDAEFGGDQTPDGEIEALRILASAYRHHSDYRAEWEPEATP